MRKGGKLEGWKVERLGDVCEIDKIPNRKKNLPYVGLEHIESNTGKFIGSTEPQSVKSMTFNFSDKHVLYGRLRPYLKKVLLPDFEGHCSSEIFPLKVSNQLDRSFLFHWLLSDETTEKINATSTGARMPRANMNAVLDFEIPIPPLPEQQRIVSVLDEAFESIAQAKSNAERNLVNARELFESLVERLFENTGKGWKTEKLKKITTKIGSGATPRGGGDSYQAEGLSLIRSLNVHDMGFRMKKLAFLDDEQADKLSNVAVESGDVLLNITGASIARCCIVPDDVLPARVNQHVSIIRLVKDEMIPEFLHYALISKTNKDKLLNTGEKGGATRQALTKAQIEDFSVSYPPLAEQRAIVGRLEALSAETGRLEEIYEAKVEGLEELKRSVLGKAFGGEL
jgi:type I restriction enzyme S subunit